MRTLDAEDRLVEINRNLREKLEDAEDRLAEKSRKFKKELEDAEDRIQELVSLLKQSNDTMLKCKDVLPSTNFVFF